jgi:hypothetical protein
MTDIACASLALAGPTVKSRGFMRVILPCGFLKEEPRQGNDRRQIPHASYEVA